MRAVTTSSRGALLLDGRPALIQAGALHYFRLPHPDLWAPVLCRMRMAGLNAVWIPFPWAYHSPAAGFHDFTGARDIVRLLDEVARAGLWLIPHVGPWVGLELAGGGVPHWALRLPELCPACQSDVPPEPSFSFLRHVTAWWEQLFPYLKDRQNLIMIALDPGRCGAGSGEGRGTSLHRYVAPLVDLVREQGIAAPCAVPRALYDAIDPRQRIGVLPFSSLDAEDLASPTQSTTGAEGILLLEAAMPSAGIGGEPLIEGEHPRSLQATALGRGARITVLSPAHEGLNWAAWGTAGSGATYGRGAPIMQGKGLSDAYFGARRMASTIESLGDVLARGEPDPDVTVTPLEQVQGVWTGESGTAVILRGREGKGDEVHLSYGEVGGLTVEDVPLLAGASSVLPLNWRLVSGRLLSTTLEPVLHTVVAGRELLILLNAVGGEVRLPSEYRPRRQRGPVYVEYLSVKGGPDDVGVNFDPARVASLVLDGPHGMLQLLALAPMMASRVWPLDDGWRKTPSYAASWTPSAEEPARGIVIGPEFVLPESDSGFRFLVRDKGFGYRWGPWRGSDPTTWLAPLTWSPPEAVTLPPLTWGSRPGAPEALPDYDDRGWQRLGVDLVTNSVGPNSHEGFAWYRARYNGTGTSVTIACRHACDLFLNGEQIAALNPPPGFGPVVPKTLPLPSRYQAETNVLALLVENQGRAMSWDEAAEPYGLISCSVEAEGPLVWRMRRGLTGQVERQGFPGFADWRLVTGQGASYLTWHRSEFALSLASDVEVPLFLYLDQTPTICLIYLNGTQVGRVWYPRERQRRFWLPEGLLRRKGTNELLIVQWARGAEPGIGAARVESGAALAWRADSRA
ncbi:MAG: beta-galactosidase [Anaerolineae bacterium]